MWLPSFGNTLQLTLLNNCWKDKGAFKIGVGENLIHKKLSHLACHLYLHTAQEFLHLQQFSLKQKRYIHLSIKSKSHSVLNINKMQVKFNKTNIKINNINMPEKSYNRWCLQVFPKHYSWAIYCTPQGY